MADQLEVGARVRVTELRGNDEVPGDVLGLEGVVQWVTPGFAGERGYVEVQLSDGRVFQFQPKELEET